MGSYADKPFPLLLKLIDVREKLSVQVHPNDTYAAARENGKLGKTEAWLVLDTPPKGGELVYGVRAGDDPAGAEAKRAKRAKPWKKLLNRVKVFPGDVCYIPAGCVHAVTGGVLLYEIQESSDLTYRFYDWDRTDANGNRRELHLDKALDVADLRCAPCRCGWRRPSGSSGCCRKQYFTLDLIRTDRMECCPRCTSSES